MEKRPVAQVHRHLRQGFVHGHPGCAEPAHPGPLGQRLPEGLPQADADVFHGVVLIHLQVAFGLDGQVKIAVGREQVEHVVEKRDAGVDGGAAAAVQLQFQIDFRFPGLPVDFTQGHSWWSPWDCDTASELRSESRGGGAHPT